MTQNKILEENKSVKQLYFIRAAAILIIIVFHLYAELGRTDSALYGYANGAWGTVGVTLFFLLSGYLHCMKYPTVNNTWKFYKKRWISIYPMFYITFIIAYILAVFVLKRLEPDYGGSAAKLIYTALGIDEYLAHYSISSYALVGEWFTLVIVLIYILYPLLAWCFENHRGISSFVMAFLYFANLKLDWFTVPDYANPITGIFVFWLGMYLYKYRAWLFDIKYSKRIVCAVAVCLIVPIVFVKLPMNALLRGDLVGISLFIILYIIWDGLKYIPGIPKICEVTSKYSYAVYLNHHFVILYFAPVLMANLPGMSHLIPLLTVLLIIIAAYAFAVYKIYNVIFCTAKAQKESS